jgi:hypothetical protein
MAKNKSPASPDPEGESVAKAKAERRLPLAEWAAREGVSATLVRALQVRHGAAARFTAKEWQTKLDGLKKVKV